MRSAANPRRKRAPSPRRAGRRQHVQGFTLIEVGLVVGVLALLAVLVSDFYIAQLNLRYAKERADGAVRDMRQIMDAALAWRDHPDNLNDFWPNDANEIAISQLETDGYLPRIPPNRYTGCPGPTACGNYTLLGWDRDVSPNGAYTENFMTADDLVVRVDVWGADAHGIAAQLPLGEAFLVSSTASTRRYRVEARLAYDGFGDRFVHLRNEGRALAFGQVLDEDRDERLPLGDLRGVARITWQRDVPLNADGSELDLYERDADGAYRPKGPSPDAPQIVAAPQGADLDDTETGSGITFDKESVTVHGDLLIRQPAPRDRPVPAWSVGAAVAGISANAEAIAALDARLSGAGI